jgi:drug/metabolite transporter (DMT)-like permease
MRRISPAALAGSRCDTAAVVGQLDRRARRARRHFAGTRYRRTAGCRAFAVAAFHFSGLRQKLKKIQGKPVLLAIGFFGGGLHLAFQWLGLHYTTATSATLYLSTAPIFILLLSRPMLGERIAARQWLGVAVSFCGVALIGTQGKLSLVSFNVGDALALLSMLFWGTYTVLLRMRSDDLDMAEFLTVLCAMGLVAMLPWVAFELVQGMQMKSERARAVAVLYSAIGSLLLAGAGWAYVVKRIGAARAGVTMHLMPA